jgi:cobalamin biosynthesis Mg chelatase CobN
VTICHATGSATNPYVRITISRNALHAHTRHQDGRDIVDPAGDCPGTARSAAAAVAAEGGPAKVALCHATGSLTNPFVLITVAIQALAGHERHQDGEDIVNPTGPCPGGEARAAKVAGVTAQGRARFFAKDDATARPGRGVLGVSASSPESPDSPGASKPGAAGARQAAARSNSSDDGSLPYTGVDVLAVVLIGAALLLAGWRIRKSAAANA